MAVGDRAHEADDVELAFRQVDLSAEQRDAGAILLGLIQKFERVASGAGAAAEHAYDEARSEGDQFFESLRSIVRVLQEFRTIALQHAGQGAGEIVIHERADIARSDLRVDVGIEHFKEIFDAVGCGVGAEFLERLE